MPFSNGLAFDSVFKVCLKVFFLVVIVIVISVVVVVAVAVAVAVTVMFCVKGQRSNKITFIYILGSYHDTHTSWITVSLAGWQASRLTNWLAI